MPQPIRRLLLAGLLTVPLALTACDSTTGGRSRVRAEETALRAEQLKDAGVTDEALAEFERAIAENPSLTVAYMGAADIYRERGDFGLAEQRYREAKRLEPANFEAQLYHGLVLQLLDRVAEAIRSYLNALALRPDDFEANLNIATAYLQLGEPAQARRFAERAVRLDEESGPARANLGAVYAALDQHEAAVVEYQQSAELMQLTPELLLNLADSLAKAGRYTEAAATLQQLVRIEPSQIAHERRGAALFKLRLYDEALDAFRAAADLDPAHYPAWNGIGVCLLNEYLWSDRTDKDALAGAVDALRRSLRIESSQPRIIELLRRYG